MRIYATSPKFESLEIRTALSSFFCHKPTRQAPTFVGIAENDLPASWNVEMTLMLQRSCLKAGATAKRPAAFVGTFPISRRLDDAWKASSTTHSCNRCPLAYLGENFNPHQGVACGTNQRPELFTTSSMLYQTLERKPLLQCQSFRSSGHYARCNAQLTLQDNVQMLFDLTKDLWWEILTLAGMR